MYMYAIRCTSDSTEDEVRKNGVERRAGSASLAGCGEDSSRLTFNPLFLLWQTKLCTEQESFLQGTQGLTDRAEM